MSLKSPVWVRLFSFRPPPSDGLHLARAYRSLLIEWIKAALTHLWRFPVQFKLDLLINIAPLACSDGQWILFELLSAVLSRSDQVFRGGSSIFIPLCFVKLIKVLHARRIRIDVLFFLLLFSFSSTQCDPERRSREEPGPLPCYQTPARKPCGEQNLGYKVGKLCPQTYNQWDFPAQIDPLTATPIPTKKEDSQHQNFPLVVYIITSLLSSKGRLSHAPKHLIQVCLCNGLPSSKHTQTGLLEGEAAWFEEHMRHARTRTSIKRA